MDIPKLPFNAIGREHGRIAAARSTLCGLESEQEPQADEDF